MGAMNDISELWSLPWHALQHSLAHGFGAEGPVGAPPNSGIAAVRVVAAPASSWLARARRVTTQVPQQNR